jgi:hypothetical protein
MRHSTISVAICIFASLFIGAILCHTNAHGASGTEQVKSNINSEHVLEHLDGIINKPRDQMTPEEQNFYYFKLHDYDNNNKLDGLELVSAFAHNDGMLKFCLGLRQ